MKHEELLQRQHNLFKHLSSLPRMILVVKESENVPELLLHDLCHPSCFNLNKAAYFVDNPDFDCLQGVAGISRDEVFFEDESVWDSPEKCGSSVKGSAFNKKVCSMDKCSIKKAQEPDEQLVNELAQMLGIERPCSCCWETKHDNYGLLIFEKEVDSDDDLDEYLLNGVSILSFCPIS